MSSYLLEVFSLVAFLLHQVHTLYNIWSHALFENSGFEERNFVHRDVEYLNNVIV